MNIQLEVEVKIRKGLGPDSIIKNFPVGFDDLPSNTTWEEIKGMAAMEINDHFARSEDYRHYGNNWEIIDYH